MGAARELTKRLQEWALCEGATEWVHFPWEIAVCLLYTSLIEFPCGLDDEMRLFLCIRLDVSHFRRKKKKNTVNKNALGPSYFSSSAFVYSSEANFKSISV